MPVSEVTRGDIAVCEEQSPTKPYQILVRDLETLARVGVHAREERHSQPVRFNITLLACRGGEGLGIVDYSEIVDGIRGIATRQHIRLLEDLAEEIASFCLSDARVSHASVRIEKLAAVEGTASVGIEIERSAAS